MHQKYKAYQDALDKLFKQQQYEQIRCVVPKSHNALFGDQVIYDFSSNDALKLSHHPHIKKNTIKYVLKWGVGSTPSRTIEEQIHFHKEIEEKLKALLEYPELLLYSSAMQSTQEILSSLVNHKTDVFIDRLLPYDLIQGLAKSKAHIYRYERGNLNQLNTLLARTQTGNTKILLTESLSSSNGDLADINRLIELADKYNALLFLDDRSSVATHGKHGMGCASCKRGIDLVFGHFAAGSGSFASYISSNAILKEYITSFCHSLTHSHALAPSLLGAIGSAIELIPDMEPERKKLCKKSARLREELSALNWNIGESSSHIIPLIIEDQEKLNDVMHHLASHNILATKLCPPQIYQEGQRVILKLNHGIQDKQIKHLLEVLQSFQKESLAAC